MDNSVRLTLANQFLILSKIEPNKSNEHLERYKILKDGFSDHYDEVFDILGDELTMQECLFVKEILSLYERFAFSYQSWPAGAITVDRITFFGFYGNSDHKLINYAQYLLDNGYCADIKLSDRGLDSHHPNKDIYRRMLNSAKKIPHRDGSFITDEEFRMIQHEMVHPSNR